MPAEAVLGSSEQSGPDKLTPHMLRAILAEGKNLDAKFLSMSRGNASHRLLAPQDIIWVASLALWVPAHVFARRVANLHCLQPPWQVVDII